MHQAMNTAHFNKILVVDDATANLQLLTNVLTEHGYTVYPASDGELALEFVQSILPDLILLDIRMPGMDGYEVCRRLKAAERTCSIPIIFISILEDEGDKVKGFQEGAVDYITKPFQPEEVLARVRIHLRLRELTEHLEQQVASRTAELRAANEQLQIELAERARAEAALKRERTLIANIMETSPIGITTVDANGQITFANTQAVNILGLTKDEITQRTYNAPDWRITDFSGDPFPDENLPFRQVMTTRQSVYDVQHAIEWPDGRRVFLSINGAPILNASGDVESVVFALQDITKRKRAEEALQTSEAELKIAQQIAHVGSWNWIIATDKITWSEELYRIFGLDPQLPPPNYDGLSRLYTPETWTQHNQVVARAIESGEPYQEEFEFIRPDGTHGWLISKGEATRDADGKIIQLHGIAQDITERKRAEKELHQYQEHLEDLVAKRTEALEQEILERKRIEHALHEAKDAAEAANRAKSEFLANMSHELRTPLNAILGYAQLLKREKTLTVKQQEQLTAIHSSGEYLLTLISDLLDLTRIEAQRMAVDVHPFNLPAILRNILDASRLKTEARGLFIRYEEVSPLPAMVKGDDRKLRQVLLNLLDNAVKYTEHGGVTLRVEANGKRQTANGKRQTANGKRQTANGKRDEEETFRPSPFTLRLCFEVEDTGIGISDEQMQTIFEPFTRGDRRPTEGIGLGLAICRRLIELMGGKLSVASEVGKGSTFTVELELEGARTGEGEANTPENAVIGYHGERKRVLIVDDHITNLAMLVSTLEPLGFVIETAESGEETIHKAAATRPDLILLDLLMPGMDGHKTLRRLRRMEGLDQVKVIGVSAAVADKARVEAFAAACDDFMAKPMDIGELLETLQAQLQLDWIEEGAEAMESLPSAEGSFGDTATPEKWPPQTVVDDLLDKVEWGDFTRLEAILDRLEGEDNEYKGFCETIRIYTRRFDDDAIIDYLSQ